jgi:hypothetical protein
MKTHKKWIQLTNPTCIYLTVKREMVHQGNLHINLDISELKNY